MSRRGNTGPPISLFSFQDIITSVSAVIILMTLLLALELLNRKFGSASADEQRPVDDTLAMRAEIDVLEQHRDELARELESTSVLVEMTAASSSEQLQSEIQITREQIARFKSELDRLAQELSTARDKERAAEANSRELDRAALAELRSQIVENQRRLAKLKSSNALIFRPANDTGKRAWLVDISASRLVIEPLGDPGQRQAFEKAGIFGGSKFGTWLKTLDAGREYFMLLVRPSGIDHYLEIEPLLKARNFDLGFDLIGEQQQLAQAEPTP